MRKKHIYVWPTMSSTEIKKNDTVLFTYLIQINTSYSLHFNNKNNLTTVIVQCRVQILGGDEQLPYNK